MTEISETLKRLEDWREPRDATHAGESCPFLLACRTAAFPADEGDIDLANAGPDLRALWETASEVELFVDYEYGQWGLKILSPLEAVRVSENERENRPDDFNDDDIVVGRFYGDSEQLVIDRSRANEGFFPVLVQLPVDQRSEWPTVAPSFANFLETYISLEGEKFWERQIAS